MECINCPNCKILIKEEETEDNESEDNESEEEEFEIPYELTYNLIPQHKYDIDEIKLQYQNEFKLQVFHIVFLIVITTTIN
jgi:hypothetical protein